MPISTNLNKSPYYDDFAIDKQFYRVLFKPRRAVQARELTQLQTILQNQIEQFGDNIYKEGSIIKGVNFTELADLKYIKVNDKINEDGSTFDVSQYVGPTELDIEENRDVHYELVSSDTQLRASIVAATRGFTTTPPDLNTFYINFI